MSKDWIDVSKQPHYMLCEIEPIDFILANRMNYLEGNIIKYISRYKRKGGLKDLEKAKQYLEWLIDDVDEKDGIKEYIESVGKSHPLETSDIPSG